MLTRLGSSPSYTRAVVLGRVARCWQIAQRVDLAARYLREALGVAAALPPSNGVKALRGTLRSDFGDALRAAGHYRDAREAYEDALTTARELNDMRGQAVELGLARSPRRKVTRTRRPPASSPHAACSNRPATPVTSRAVWTRSRTSYRTRCANSPSSRTMCRRSSRHSGASA
ncbi:MAG TPA: tetratricopeptide repeat protein [Vicinamibacterales bacterium]|jgi:hypothetical protein